MQFGAADLLILDALDYPFTIPLEALTQNRDRPLSRLLADWTTPRVSAPTSLPAQLGYATVATNPVSLDGGFAVSSFRSTAPEPRAPADRIEGLTVNLHGFRATFLKESAAVLGTRAGQAFGQLSSSTLSAGFRHAATLGAWTLTADAEIAWTAPTVQPGLLRALSPIVSSTARLSASRMLGLDRLTLAVTQPLRAERGTATFHLPQAMDGPATIVHHTVTTTVVPESRSLQFGLVWNATPAHGRHACIALVRQVNPDHRAAPRPEHALLARYARTW